MLCCRLRRLHCRRQLFIIQFTQESQREVYPCWGDPVQRGQLLLCQVDDAAQVALQGLILFERDKGACHAANNSSSSSGPSIVSTSIKCSAIRTSLSLLSRKIVSAVA